MAAGPTPGPKRGDGIGHSGSTHQKGEQVSAITGHNGTCIVNAGLLPHIPETPRNRKGLKRGRKRLCNAAIPALRLRVERTLGWGDKCKCLLLRFERIQQRH
jgi:hypothetical protein